MGHKIAPFLISNWVSAWLSAWPSAWMGAWMGAFILSSGGLTWAAAPEQDTRVDQLLEQHIQAYLCGGPTPTFQLRYRGPITNFRSKVCYHFVGYNETCLDPHIDWLTPATRINLYAPGQVPFELLAGYELLVRYPLMSDKTFRYPTAQTQSHCAN